MKRLSRGLYLAGLLALVGCLLPSSAQTPQPTATPAPGAAVDLKSQLAVVELNKLLELHPDYEKLKNLDSLVEQLANEKREISDRARRELLKSGRDKFIKAMDQARAEMEAEQAAISGEMQGLANALQAQMAAELGEIQARLKRGVDEEINKIRPAETARLNDVGQQAVGEYGENLKLMAARNLTAHKLEREKAVKAEIDAERNRLEQEVAAYEDQVSLKYQEEKLNLQLKMQNNPSEDVEKVTRERLNAIDDEVAAAKAEKRKEVDATLSAFHAKKQAQFEADVKAYEARLRDEVIAKVGGRRQELQNQPGTSVPPSPEVAAKIKAAQETMQREMERRKAELTAQMSQKQSEARSRLEAKAAQVKERLARLEQDLQAEILKRKDSLDKKSKAKLEQLENDLEKARADRKLVFEKMRSDISTAVGKVAESKSIPCVIGAYVENLELTDLSDLSMVEVKQLVSR